MLHTPPMQGSGFRLDVNTESQNLSHTRLLTSLILSPEAALTLTRHSDTHIVYVEWTANGVGPGVVIYHRLSLSDGIAARLLPNRSGTSGPLVTSVIYAFRLRHTQLMHATTDHTQNTYDTHIHIHTRTHTHTTRGHGDVDCSHTQSKYSL